MLIISDGGSTKADWRILTSQGDNINLTTTGFNPNYDSPQRIANILLSELAPKMNEAEDSEVWYYGTGCWDSGRKSVVKSAIEGVFQKSRVIIQHDLLGAARATCGDQPGIACILGTGSNSVLYDGENEVDNVTNLGFLLGDEGSGSHIGKELVKSFFYREMPADLQPIMEKECPNGRKDILDKIYGGGIPAAYLASFTRLFAQHQQHSFVRKLISNCFTEFLNRHIVKYEGHKTLPIHFVGSIAFHFESILRETLIDNGLRPGVILQKPIENLFQYHLNKLSGPVK
jgi:N-acetylglucosamine kinase-like BadF-type ATPase